MNFLKTENNNSINLSQYTTKNEAKFSSQKPQEHEALEIVEQNEEIEKIIFDAIYYEVSAKNGSNISECVELTTKVVLYDKYFY